MIRTRGDHYSAVLVTAFPERFDECSAGLAALPGVTVSVPDRDRHRMIVVIEAATREGLEDRHAAIGSLPTVATASPVLHYIDDDSAGHVPAGER